MGEHVANMLKSFAMARRPDRAKSDALTSEELKQLRNSYGPWERPVSLITEVRTLDLFCSQSGREVR
jgi:hypothetical protein